MRVAIAILITVVFYSCAIGQEASTALKPFKLLGDETSLVRVKAEPKTFLGQPFVVGGEIRISDFYFAGYDRAQESHYSLSFRQASTPTRFGEACWLNLRRDIGVEVVDRIAKNTPGDESVRIRAKAVLDRVRYVEGAWQMLELLDVQFATADGEAWEPWFFESRRNAAAEAEARSKKAAEDTERGMKEEQEKLAEQQRAARTRTWTDKTGRFSVVAEYRGMVSDKVLLRKKNGDVVKVPRDRLSKADQKWLDERRKSTKR